MTMREVDKRIRWGLYGVALVISFTIVVLGELAVRSDEWEESYIITYGLWMMSFGAFILCFSQEETFSRFILRGTYYLMCSALTLTFFSAVDTSDNINHLIPACAVLGIFLGTGMKHCWVVVTGAWRWIQRQLVRLLLLDSNQSLPQYEIFPRLANPSNSILSVSEPSAPPDRVSSTSSSPAFDIAEENPWA